MYSATSSMEGGMNFFFRKAPQLSGEGESGSLAFFCFRSFGGISGVAFLYVAVCVRKGHCIGRGVPFRPGARLVYLDQAL